MKRRKPIKLHPIVRKDMIDRSANSADRAHALVMAIWGRDLPPVILSAVFRDLQVEVGHVRDALNTLSNDK